MTALAAGRAHTCAVLQGGDVACWGENERGQLGDDDEGRPRPTLVNNARYVTSVVAGRAFTCVLQRSGGVRCFGAGERGQLGDGKAHDRPRAGPRSLANASVLAAGAEHACAIVDDGRVRCWGNDRYGQVGAAGNALFVPEPAAVAGLAGARALALGAAHSCALLDDGSVWCWGGDFAGQRGDGDDDERARSRLPSRVRGLAGVTALTAGAHHTCALMTGGGVSCWGAAAGGKLGAEVVDDQAAPVDVPALRGARALAAGGTFTCGLVGDVVRCLGGAFGTTREVPAKEATLLVAGHAHACFVVDGGARCLGDASGAQLGDGRRGGLASVRPRAVPSLDDAVRIAASGERTCALRSNAQVSCWGAGQASYQRVAEGGFVDVVVAKGAVAGRREGAALVLLEEDALSTGARLTRLSALDLAEGRRHACAVTDDGAVYCWGAGASGQLGNGSRKDRARPTRVTKVRAAVDVDVGAAHSCALSAGGAVWCWGSHVLGELGHPRRTGSDEPVRVPLPEVAELDVGEHHACARSDAGAVYCWGAGKHGELGDGQQRGSRYPVEVVGLDDAIHVAVGGQHACAVRVDGEVVCWGEGESGQLGDGARRSSARPLPVPGLSAIVEIVAGARHTCARSERGQVLCWGAGDRGQLGQGAPLFVAQPVVVEMPAREGDRG